MDDILELGAAQVDRSALADLCRRHGVKELAVFGSVIRGEMTPDSDIDIMVEFEPDARIGIIQFQSLADDLESLLGRKVDLVTKRGLKPWVRPHVLRDARII